MFLNEDFLAAVFEIDSQQPLYLDFGLGSDNLNLNPILIRSESTINSFKQNSLDEIAALEGSPSFEIISEVVQIIESTGILPNLTGIGIEIGSGLGLLSAAVIKNDKKSKIKGIVAIEAVLPFAQSGIRNTSKEILNNQSYKILPCYGSFNKMEIESGAIDFILQIEALHHADDLSKAINESFRVLKNGGYFISIDRSWPTGVTREVLDSLLDYQYPEPWLIKKGFHNKHLTRRENGEHEYTDYDWISSFEKSGFKLLNKINLHPKFKFIHFVKRIICLLKFESLFKIKIQSRPGIFRGFLLSIFNIRSTSFGSLILTPHPRPLTLFVWEK